MKQPTYQDRQNALSLLETHSVEKAGQNKWVVLDGAGNKVNQAKTKSIALFHAVSAEGKVDQLLAM